MSKSLDRLSLLSTFARIAERGSISAAARDLDISQASASRQLQELEKRLKVQLAHRTTHSLALTEAGTACLHDARQLLDGWDALVEQQAGHAAELRGALKVVAPIALSQKFLTRAALNFQKDHPGITINWQQSDDQIRFSEIGCDFWIKVGPITDDTLIVRPVATVERIIVAAPKLVQGRTIKSPRDLTRLACAALEPFEGGSIPLAASTGKAQTIRPDVAFSSNNVFAVQEAALLGVGFALLPRWLVDADIGAGALQNVLPKWRASELTINVAYLPSSRHTRRLNAFAAYITDAILKIPGINAAQSDDP